MKLFWILFTIVFGIAIAEEEYDDYYYDDDDYVDRDSGKRLSVHSKGMRACGH